MQHQAGIKRTADGAFTCEFKNYKDLPEDIKVLIHFFFLFLSLFFPFSLVGFLSKKKKRNRDSWLEQDLHKKKLMKIGKQLFKSSNFSRISEKVKPLLKVSLYSLFFSLFCSPLFPFFSSISLQNQRPRR